MSCAQNDVYWEIPVNIYEIGLIYELRAARYVKKRGYKILDRRYRALDGEIDLICRDGDVIVFLEVKARPEGRMGKGISAVHADKRRRIRAAANVYLKHKHFTDAACRFDILEFTRAGAIYMENAF